MFHMRNPSNPLEPPCPAVYMMMTPEEIEVDKIRMQLNIKRLTKEFLYEKPADS